jgi:hypothetical protein
MAEEEKKQEEKKSEETKPVKAAPAKTEKKKINMEELAARISLYIAFLTLATGVYIKFFNVSLLGIKPSNFLLLTMIWLLTSIAIVLWNISKKL